MLLIGLFHVPAYLQLAPLPEELCSSGNATNYQRQIGITGLSPLRGTLRAAPSKSGQEYHCTLNLHRRKQPHHTVFRLSVDRSLRLGRSWRQKPRCYAETERSVALTIQLSRNREGGLIAPFTLQRTFLRLFLSTGFKKQKIFLPSSE